MNNTLYAGATLRNLIDTLGPVKKAEKTPTSRKLREEAGEPIITTDTMTGTTATLKKAVFFWFATTIPRTNSRLRSTTFPGRSTARSPSWRIQRKAVRLYDERAAGFERLFQDAPDGRGASSGGAVLRSQ